MSNRQNGYTLAEILIVVSILVVLGLALLVGINPMAQIFKAYDTRRKADLDKIKIAMENYYADHDCYPTFPSLDSKGRPTYTCDSNVLSPYITAMPCDPNTKKPYVIYETPIGSTCPQQFATYAYIYSASDPQANNIPNCPSIVAVKSTDMKYLELIFGCEQKKKCPGLTYYGCKSGACVVIAEDDIPPCSPNFCDDPVCGGGRSGGTLCTVIDADSGGYLNECIPTGN